MMGHIQYVILLRFSKYKGLRNGLLSLFSSLGLYRLSKVTHRWQGTYLINRASSGWAPWHSMGSNSWLHNQDIQHRDLFQLSRLFTDTFSSLWAWDSIFCSNHNVDLRSLMCNQLTVINFYPSDSVKPVFTLIIICLVQTLQKPFVETLWEFIRNLIYARSPLQEWPWYFSSFAKKKTLINAKLPPANKNIVNKLLTIFHL